MNLDNLPAQRQPDGLQLIAMERPALPPCARTPPTGCGTRTNDRRELHRPQAPVERIPRLGDASFGRINDTDLVICSDISIRRCSPDLKSDEFTFVL